MSFILIHSIMQLVPILIHSITQLVSILIHSITQLVPIRRQNVQTTHLTIL